MSTRLHRNVLKYTVGLVVIIPLTVGTLVLFCIITPFALIIDAGFDDGMTKFIFDGTKESIIDLWRPL